MKICWVWFWLFGCVVVFVVSVYWVSSWLSVVFVEVLEFKGVLF